MTGLVRRGLTWTLMLGAAFGSGCGGEDEEPGAAAPDGCYIPALMRCDCELTEEACGEDVGVWTDGCSSCS